MRRQRDPTVAPRSRPVKGPYERLKYDLRRVWECPRCNRHERTTGAMTACHCQCQSQSQTSGGTALAMKLREDGVRRVTASAQIASPDTAEPAGRSRKQGEQPPSQDGETA